MFGDGSSPAALQRVHVQPGCVLMTRLKAANTRYKDRTPDLSLFFIFIKLLTVLDYGPRLRSNDVDISAATKTR